MRTLCLICALASLPACSSSHASGPAPDEQGSDGATAPSDAGGTADGTSAGPVDAGLPPIDGGALVSSLTDTQLGQICDWMNEELGIYDASVMCINHTIIPSTRAQCIAAISYNSDCFLTVQQVENCVAAELPTQGCSTPGPDCMMMLECFTGDAGM
jgi:hypothetical protein